MYQSTTEKARVLTLDIKPRNSEAIKPAELIQVSGHHELTLNARRAITILWHNAHLQGIAEGRDYSVEIDDLKPDSHKGYEMVEEAIEALMRSILILRMPDGKTRRVQFLGGNDLDDPDRPAGVLTYSFDKRLIEALKDSTIWGKIALPVLMAFTSKYTISLYENLAQIASLSKKTYQDYTLDEFRDLLGVSPGRYKAFGELNKHVIKPAIAEVNALAPFSVSLVPVKQGKRVVQIRVGWWAKEGDALREAWNEMQRTRVGRRARIAEVGHAPLPSINRTVRNARLDHRKASPKTS
ncbi:MAG TPA: replication initiation protein [Gemmataceae bacterium]|nr:replication initiation protein [Gemmataceae bacterium]